MRFLSFLGLGATALLMMGCTTTREGSAEANLAESLTLYATFDNGPHAKSSNGDNILHHSPTMRRPRTGAPGLPTDGSVTIVPGEGRFGDALRFHRKTEGIVFFEANENIAYRPTNWSGTVSFWLRVDPETELAPGFTDPIQITPRDWNDAAFFVEFGKDEKPRHFRLGSYADLKVWNPQNRDWNSIPMSEKPLVSVERPPFAKDKWTHVVFTWENFNTGQSNSVATLYLDGQRQGALTDRVQTFTWNPAQTKIMLGLSYIGYFDELAIFDRALSATEVLKLHGLKAQFRVDAK